MHFKLKLFNPPDTFKVKVKVTETLIFLYIKWLKNTIFDSRFLDFKNP